MFSAVWSITLVIVLQGAPPQPDRVREAWPDDRPFARLVQNLGADLVALPSRESAVILGVGGGAALALHAADDNLSGWAAGAGPSSYTRLGRTIGDGWIQGGGAVATYVAGRLAGSPRATHVGSDLIRVQVLNGVITTGLKYAVGRERPNSSNAHSFPSGHTSATFATAAVLHGHFDWKVGLPAYAVAGFVGWTRARDNVHWLSDVAMGAALGIAAGHTVTRGHRERVWRIIPMTTRGGAAIYVVR